MRSYSILWLVASMSLVSCGVSFPDESRIEDLRILDVTVDPPEIAILQPGHSATTAADLISLFRTVPNLEPVRLTALVVHPDPDAELGLEWLGCAPELQGLPCPEARRFALSTGSATVAEFSPVAALRERLGAAEDPEGALRAVASDPRDLLNGLYAHVILSASVVSANIRVDTRGIEATKRLVVFEPALVRAAIFEGRRLGQETSDIDFASLGLPMLCTQATPADLTAIDVYLASRKPNRPPRFIGIEASVDGLPIAVDEPITLDPGDDLRLRGLVPTEDRENYALIDDNCQLEKFQETLAFSWFTTAGSLSPPLTIESDDPDESRTHTRFVVPKWSAVARQGGRVRIFAVLRDGRGGSRHREIAIRVREP